MLYDIIVCGHLCLDLIPAMENITPENLATTGKLYETGALHISTGGAVSNTGLALHKLGMNVGLMSSAGDDLLGQIILAFLRERDPRLDEHIRLESNVPSSYTVVLTPKNRDRTFLHCTGTNSTFGYDQIDFDIISQSIMFHLGYPTVLPNLYANNGEELVRIFNKVHSDLHIITSLDLTLPDASSASGQANWKDILYRTLPNVDIFIPSIEEIVFMLRRKDYDKWGDSILARVTTAYLDDLAEELVQMGSAIVGFKLGVSGVYVRTTADESRLAFLGRLNQVASHWVDKRAWHPAFKVTVAGTTGAGDSAYAGFLTALYRGLDIQSCVCWACAVGACNVEAPDATSGVLTWDATARRLAGNWKTISPLSQ